MNTTTRPAINIRQAAKRNKPAGLTVGQATKDARKIVNAVMPNVMTTVDSRMSWDAGLDVHVVITTITFPAGQAWRHTLFARITQLPGYLSRRAGDSSITITRKVG